jgi:MscS family membrane protein
VKKLFFAVLLCLSFNAMASSRPQTSLLAPVNVNSPQDTMTSYLKAMDEYSKAIEADDDDANAHLDRAARTFSVGHHPLTIRRKKAREAAIFLREILDRIVKIDVAHVPGLSNGENGPVLRWNVPNTEITILRHDEGVHKGEYLFSRETTDRLHEFYEKVAHLPYLPGAKGAGYKKPVLEKSIPGWAKETTLFFPNWKWIGLFIFIVLGLFIKALTKFGFSILRKLAEKSKTVLDEKLIDALNQPVSLVAAGGFWLFSIYLLDFSGSAFTFLTVVVQVIFTWGVIWAFYRLSDIVADQLDRLAKKADFPLDDQLVPILRRSLHIFVVIFGVLIGLQNLGVNVMSIIAGLGLGGLAFALAAKDTAANLFGSIMIFMDRPFRVGDWIVADSVEGTVEEIGFRSTRIRTFYNSIVSFPNSSLANASIDNMGLRRYRRIRTYLGLTYDTPPEKMEAFLEGVKQILRANKNIRQDYFHVVFNGYGAHSLDILLYCFLEVRDWSVELVEKQNIFLEILRLSKEVGVEFAFPTQTLHVDSFPEKQPRLNKKSYSDDELVAAARSFGPTGQKSKPAGLGIYRAPYQEGEGS